MVAPLEVSQNISVEIEQMRGQMVMLGTRHGFLHPDVQSCSKKLDLLLLEYYAASKFEDQY
jgi:hypothetical protein